MALQYTMSLKFNVTAVKSAASRPSDAIMVQEWRRGRGWLATTSILTGSTYFFLGHTKFDQLDPFFSWDTRKDTRGLFMPAECRRHLVLPLQSSSNGSAHTQPGQTKLWPGTPWCMTKSTQYHILRLHHIQYTNKSRYMMKSTEHNQTFPRYFS